MTRFLFCIFYVEYFISQLVTDHYTGRAAVPFVFWIFYIENFISQWVTDHYTGTAAAQKTFEKRNFCSNITLLTTANKVFNLLGCITL